MADVVAVADVGEAQAAQVAESRSQGQQVAERLDRVEAFGQAVVDRHGRAGGECFEIGLAGEPAGDAVDVAAHDVGGVGQRFAARQLQIVDAEKGRMAAELLHAGFEGVARPRARVLEDHAERLAEQQRMRRSGRPQRFQPERRLEQVSRVRGIARDCANRNLMQTDKREKLSMLRPQ